MCIFERRSHPLPGFQLLTVLLQQAHRKCGIKTSAVPFVFWFLLLLCDAVGLYSHVTHSVCRTWIIDRSINLSISLNINIFNHKHCHVFYCKQLHCGEILTVIFCYDKQIIWNMASNRSVQCTLK